VLVAIGILTPIWLPKKALFPPIPASESVALSYSTATQLLISGKYAVYAIALPERAIKLDPENPDYHVALGCAYTDRAAVIYRAFAFRYLIASERSGYTLKLLQWELQWMLGTKTSKPVQPPARSIRLKDDGTEFRTGDYKTIYLLFALGRLANKQFDIAQHVARTNGAIADAHYYHAWSILIFSRMRLTGNNHDLPEDAETNKFRVLNNMPSSGAALTEIRRSLCPVQTSSDYWRSAGDIADESQWDSNSDNGDAMTASKSVCTPYYQTALKLQPNDEALWVNVSVRNWRINRPLSKACMKSA
jgi:hypothetical protein